jgi:predicted RNase H-like HicB family nuclease
LTHQFSTIITKENHLYVTHCPELDITSQGETMEDAINNLKEAIELYLEDEDTEIESTDFKPMVTKEKSSSSC